MCSHNSPEWQGRDTVKFGDFLFPDSRDPADDGPISNEAAARGAACRRARHGGDLAR
jgi:hypothetical protein